MHFVSEQWEVIQNSVHRDCGLNSLFRNTSYQLYINCIRSISQRGGEEYCRSMFQNAERFLKSQMFNAYSFSVFGLEETHIAFQWKTLFGMKTTQVTFKVNTSTMSHPVAVHNIQHQPSNYSPLISTLTKCHHSLRLLL